MSLEGQIGRLLFYLLIAFIQILRPMFVLFQLLRKLSFSLICSPSCLNYWKGCREFPTLFIEVLFFLAATVPFSADGKKLSSAKH